MVLTFLEREGAISLGMKSRKIGEGKWNGYGGNVDNDEDLEAAAKREVFEEVGVTVHTVEYRGYVDFHRNGKINEVHMYTSSEFEGEPSLQKEEEGHTSEFSRMEWFDKNNLPYTEMMAGDQYWLSTMLNEGYVEGEVTYSDDWELMDHSFSQVEEARREVTLR